MTSPDQLPDDEREQTYTLRVNRDTLILIAAIGFLAIAVLLALLFPPTSSNVVQQSTSTLGTSTTAIVRPTSAAQATSIVIVPTALQPSAYPTSLSEPGAPTSQAYPGSDQAYPSPGAGAVQPTIFRPTNIPVPTVALSNPTAVGQPTFGPTIISFSPTPQFIAATTARSTSVAVQPATQPPATTQPVATTQPRATSVPVATSEPRATSIAAATNTPDSDVPVQPTTATQPSTVPRPTATARPAESQLPEAIILKGNTTWRASDSPVRLDRDLVVGPGAVLQIEPGVEVKLAPGVSITNQGTMRSLGQPGQPVRFSGTGSQRWEGIFGRDNSEMLLEHTEIKGGGAGGTVIGVETTGQIGFRGVRVTDNGGRVSLSSGGYIEIRDSEISGNDMPYGAALELNFANGGRAVVVNNRIGGNRMSFGSPQLLIRHTSGFNELNVDIQRNLLVGQDGPNLTLSAASRAFNGNIVCNSFLNGANGLSIRSDTLQVPGFPLNIRDNVLDDHVPPIVPVYLKYGIGRGATSEVEVDMRNNWWGSELGPYEPDRHADGRGDSVGENISFDPWLGGWPSCAPRP